MRIIGFLVFVNLAFTGRAQVPGLEWVKNTEGSSGSYTAGQSIVTDLSGNVYSSGYFYGTVDFDPDAVATHNVTSAVGAGFILKVDMNGDFLWVQTMENTIAFSIAIDGTGDVFVTGGLYDNSNFGSFALSTNGGSDIFISKLASDGTFQWAKNVGGANDDSGNGIATDNSGDVYVTGSFGGTNVGFGSITMSSYEDSEDIFVSKLDTDGDFLWARYVGGDASDVGKGIATHAGHVYITGSFNYPTDSNIEFDPAGGGPFSLSFAGNQDIFVINLDNTGNFIWAKSMGGTGSESGNSIAIDGSGNIYTTGSFYETADFDPDPVDVFELERTGNPEDIFVSKLDPSGNFVWAKAFNGQGADSNGVGYSITTNTSDDVFISGYFAGTVDFDPDATTTSYIASTSGSAFVCKLTSSGDFIWADSFGGQGNNIAASIHTDDSGNAYVTGYFYDVNGDPIDFAPGSCVLNLYATDQSLFIQKIGTSPSVCGDITIDLQPVSQTVCVGAIVTFVVNASGTTNITYQWQVEMDDGDGGLYWNDISDGGSFSGTNTNILTVNTVISGQGYLRCLISGDLASDEISDEVFLAVGPNTPFVSASGFVHCGPGKVTISALGGVNGQYRWYTQASGGSPIAGEFNSTYITPVLTSATTYYVSLNNGSCESSRVPVQVAISTCQPQPGFVWAQGFGTGDMTNGTSEGDAILVDGDGNILVSGYFQGTIDFDNGPGTANLTAVGYDAYLMKLTPTGTFLWAKSFGGPSLDYGGKISLDAAGNIYMMSSFQGTADFDPGTPVVSLTTAAGSPANKADIAISKFDRDGNFIWVRQIGGASDEFMADLRADAAGNVYATGSFRQVSGNTKFGSQSTPTFTLTALGANSTDIFFTKLDASGTFLWAGNIGANIATGANFLSDAGISIDIDGSGNAYINGRISGPATVDFNPGTGTANQNISVDGAAFLLKLNSTGVYQNHYLVDNASGNAVRVDASNNIYITGAFTGTVDLDPGVGVFNGTGNGANYVTKLNSSGNFVWGKVFQPNSAGASVLFYDLAFDGSGNIYSTGYFTATTDFDPGPLNESRGLNGLSILNTFTLKLNSSGDFNWVTTMRRISGSITSATPGGITVNSAGDVYITGRYARGVDFDPGSCEFGLTNVNGSNIFISKLSPGLPIFCIDTHPSNISTCNNTTATFSVSATTDYPILYRWQKFNTATSLFEDISDTGGYSGTTTSMLTVNTAGNFGVGDYRCKIYGDRTGDGYSNAASLSLSGAIGPVAVGASSCFNTSFILTASGGLEGQYRWYDVATGGTALTGEINSTFTTPLLSATTSYYVSIFNGCESARTAVTATISAAPAAPTTTPDSACSGFAITLTATGGVNGQYRWYDVASGGTAQTGETNSTFTKPSLSATTSYFVSINNGFCESTRTEAVATIVSLPAAPLATGASRCGPGSVPLTSSGGTSGQYRWYTSASGGTPISGEVIGTYTTPSLATTTSYYVTINNGSCESTRTMVTATINTSPAAPTTMGATGCTSSTFTLSAAGGTAGQYRWYSVSSGGIAIAGAVNNTFTTPVLTTATSYYVAINDGTCESLRSIVTAIVQPCTTNQPPAIAPTTVEASIDGVVTVSLLNLLSDPDNNLDLSSLEVIVQPASGAKASIDAQRNLILDYTGISFSGTEKLMLKICDLLGACVQKEITISVLGDIVVYNGMSPNDDGDNDIFYIQYIEAIEETKTNRVSIYNRWGDLVFSVSDYDNKTRVFKGLNNNGNEIPSGTYFYKIEFSSGKETKSGYLSLKR